MALAHMIALLLDTNAVVLGSKSVHNKLWTDYALEIVIYLCKQILRDLFGFHISDNSYQRLNSLYKL